MRKAEKTQRGGRRVQRRWKKKKKKQKISLVVRNLILRCNETEIIDGDGSLSSGETKKATRLRKQNLTKARKLTKGGGERESFYYHTTTTWEANLWIL